MIRSVWMRAVCEYGERTDGSGLDGGREAPVAARARSAQLAVWMIAAFLGVIAACLILRLDEPVAGQAFGQSVAQAGARGVFAFTGQLSKQTFGVFMVDVDAGTIWCYEWNEAKGCLKLVAARSWRYDRYLEEFNVCELPPKEVESMVEMERARRLQEAGVGEE